MKSVDNVSGVNKALHDYNNAKARGNKQDMRKALMAATVEFSDYENKANKSKIKREINGLLEENGMKALDKAIRNCDKEYVTMTYKSWKYGNMTKEFRSKNAAFEYVRKNRVKEGILGGINISGRYYAINEIDPSVDR